MGKELTRDDVVAFGLAQLDEDIERVFRIEWFRPRYEVPGRRTDGSIAGSRSVLWLVARLGILVRAIVVTLLVNVLLFVVMLPLALLGDGGGLEFVHCIREHEVRGHKGCDALRFADASNHSKVWPPTLWLLESPERLVLLREDRGQLTRLWDAHGSERPRLRKSGILQWPDGSTVDLPVR